MTSRSLRHGGFTLLEVMVVITVIAIAGSMIFSYNGRRDRRSLQVRAAADQLAAVLRQTRAMAMDQKAIFGVAFNIANAPGSSGRVLNNRSGGHWYRVIGPSQHNSQQDRTGNGGGGGGYAGVYRFNRDWCSVGREKGDTAVGSPLGEIAYDWIGAKQVLPKASVRFLALADQDNGNHRFPSWRFGPTYPRPWFGEWDPATKRLYAWGGYDPDPQFLDFAQTAEPWSGTCHLRQGKDGIYNFSGFYYEGCAGRITGCTNPADRFVYADTNGNGHVDLGDPAAAPPVPPDQRTYLLEQGGEPRPLVDANWLDAVIVFFPDGSARYEDWFRLRHEYERYSRSPSSMTLFNDVPSRSASDPRNINFVGMGDRCNAINTGRGGSKEEIGITPYNNRYEASHYVDRTGFWYITLAADALDDTVTFSSAQAALATLRPMWRVGVSRLGEVKTIEVKRNQRAGTELDTAHCDEWWQKPGIGYAGFYNNLMSEGAVPEMPVEDFVTPEMLEHRRWWLRP
jgi:prepilin-type N-terminal cleavage/methylation domain-containing protein